MIAGDLVEKDRFEIVDRHARGVAEEGEKLLDSSHGRFVLNRGDRHARGVKSC